ncbi:MAG TPA: type II toxin-antitoxin system RelE/ParE family toxin [Euzebya sp.]|nr:type II toxin-antitoxin system RelE/ParE family toxin [Euzebya sp.]
MARRIRIELEPEVERWLEELTDDDFHQAAQALDRLEAFGSHLRMPFSRPLGDALFELRFYCQGVSRRITFFYGHGDRVIMLTTFRKQRANERREIERARRALLRCQAEHRGGNHG